MDKDLLKKLPKIDYLQNVESLKKIKEDVSNYDFLQCIKDSIDKFRQDILQEKISDFTQVQI
ncbi:MAG: hypothetical protein WCQ76_05785, partial [Fusobacterium sp.]